MDIIIVIVVIVFFAWLVIYRIYSEKLQAACNRIKPKGLRNTVHWLLAATWIFSAIIVVFGFIYKIVRLFSNKGKA